MGMDDDGGDFIKRDPADLGPAPADFQEASFTRKMAPVTCDINDPIQFENPKSTRQITGRVALIFDSCESGQIFNGPGSRIQPISSTTTRRILDFTRVPEPICRNLNGSVLSRYLASQFASL